MKSARFAFEWLRHLNEEERWVAGGIVFVYVCVYGPTLGAGFLTFDDPWLVRDNPLLAHFTWSTVWRIFSDFSPETRRILGAEYLPVRDLSVLFELAIFGSSTPPMRILNLVLLLLGAGALATTMRGLPGLGRYGWLVVFACLCLHPLHVESVAWLAGRKDCLAFAFVGLATWAYSGETQRRLFLAVAFSVAAVFSKAQAVVVGPLLLTCDVLAGRKPRYRVLGSIALVILGAMAIHSTIGGQQGTRLEMPVGRTATLSHTMAVVWLRYIGLAIWPSNQAVLYDVSVREAILWLPAIGYASLALITGAAAVAYTRRRAAWAAASWIWFVIPLIPVSQVLVPLPNLMADRYMLFSVTGLAMCLAWIGNRSAFWRIAVGIWLMSMAFFSWRHAQRFRSSVELFEHATRSTFQSVKAASQLGAAYEEEGERESARGAYLMALQRAGGNPSPTALLSVLGLARTEDSAQNAQRWLQLAESRWPGHPLIARTKRELSLQRGQESVAGSR